MPESFKTVLLSGEFSVPETAILTVY